MKSTLFIFPIALVVVYALSAAQKAPIRVLLIDGQNNHNWKATTPVMVDALQKGEAFEVTVSTTPPKKSGADAWKKWAPAFKKFDVTLSNYNGELWINLDTGEKIEKGGLSWD